MDAHKKAFAEHQLMFARRLSELMAQRVELRRTQPECERSIQRIEEEIARLLAATAPPKIAA
jgi:hypothetical protein